MSSYKPPFTITAKMLTLVEQIGECLGELKASNAAAIVPELRRGNRIKTIQASLAIEGNTLSLDQVTAVLSGKRVLGLPREIQEVKNAFEAYEEIMKYSPHSVKDMLAAHKLLMSTLIDEAGAFRSGGVGITRGEQVVHVAPPAARVPSLIKELLSWLRKTDTHPLVASCIFHYEFEFIHPFSDGNGRMGRLWQTVILSNWHPVFALLPVESVVRDRQQEYYAALGSSDKSADGTLFTEFMLAAILQAIRELEANTDQVNDQVTDQVRHLLQVMEQQAYAAKELMDKLQLSHRPTFRKNYLHPALEQGLIEMTVPDKPNSRIQKYRLTAKGRRLKSEVRMENGGCK